MKRILLCLLAASVAHAEDITTTTGVTYKDVTVSRVEPDGLVLMTGDGIEKVRFESLPKETQAKYGYDPSKAAKFSSAVASAHQARNQRTIEAMQEVQARKAAEAASLEAKPVAKALDSGRGLRKFASLSVNQVSASPFSLEGTMIKLVGFDRITPQEISKGVYSVRIYQGADSLIATATFEEAAIIERSTELFVSVIEPDRHESKIKVYGNAAQYNGLSTIPTVSWR